MFTSQNTRYLKAGSNYAFDYANAQFLLANNYGTKQDILSGRLGTIVDSLGAEKQAREADISEREKSSDFSLIALGIAASIVVLFIILKS